MQSLRTKEDAWSVGVVFIIYDQFVRPPISYLLRSGGNFEQAVFHPSIRQNNFLKSIDQLVRLTCHLRSLIKIATLH